MKMTKHLLTRPTLRGLVLALAVTALSSFVARAIPYASQVTKSNDTVRFVLNHAAQGLAVLTNGVPMAHTIDFSTPGVKSFDMPGATTYSIIVTGETAKAWTQYVPDQANATGFEYPYGVSINKNAASTNFGKVYISNGRVGTTALGRACSDGIYLLRADGVDLGFKTGGKTWTGNGSPGKTHIGPDDHLYVDDFANDLAWEFNEDMSAVTQLIYATNKTGTGTSAQWVESLWVEGTKAAGNRKLFAVNGNYNDTSRKGLIMYNLYGNDAATNTGVQVIARSYYTYYPRDVARDSSGNWYLNQYRAAAGEAAAISKFDNSLTWPITQHIWATGNSYTYTYGLDLCEHRKRVAVGQAAGGNIYIFNTTDGSFVESFLAGTTNSAPRELAYDAAGNMVTVDNVIEYARFWSPGGKTRATTSSDGTFQIVNLVPDVTVAATQSSTSEGPKSTRKRRFSQSRGEGRRSGHDFGPMFMRENAQLRARTLRTESRRILYNAPPSAPRDGVHGLAWPSLTAGEGNDATGLGWQIKHLPNLLHPGDGLFTGAEP